MTKKLKEQNRRKTQSQKQFPCLKKIQKKIHVDNWIWKWRGIGEEEEEEEEDDDEEEK